jgi:hypothetical protein
MTQRRRPGIPVPLDGLRAAIAERGHAAYLLTVTADARPTPCTRRCVEGDLLAADVGKRTAANAVHQPAVSLLFPIRPPTTTA